MAQHVDESSKLFSTGSSSTYTSGNSSSENDQAAGYPLQPDSEEDPDGQ